MERYLTVILRLADNADGKLVMDQMDHIKGATLSAAAWAHLMDERNSLEYELQTLLHAYRTGDSISAIREAQMRKAANLPK